ncbi:MAG: hypothetical protein WHT06_03755 [Desulfobacterales bacterium]
MIAALVGLFALPELYSMAALAQPSLAEVSLASRRNSSSRRIVSSSSRRETSSAPA